MLCTYSWNAYAEVISMEQLIQSKKYTPGIERISSGTRHWIARFRRKTKVVSRSIRMTRADLELFQDFHRNDGIPRLQQNFLSILFDTLKFFLLNQLFSSNQIQQ
ncbi:MAG: IS1 family transposase [Candidatus Caenarcaniphilales bacterium]|nr:IS1 family transposase [Candidatus Caenarcaniphilales bacterium]